MNIGQKVKINSFWIGNLDNGKTAEIIGARMVPDHEGDATGKLKFLVKVKNTAYKGGTPAFFAKELITID